VVRYGRFFDGVVHEALVFEGALSQSQVQQVRSVSSTLKISRALSSSFKNTRAFLQFQKHAGELCRCRRSPRLCACRWRAPTVGGESPHSHRTSGHAHRLELDMASHGMAWHHMAWHGLASRKNHHVAWPSSSHGTTWHGMAWHGTTSHCFYAHFHRIAR
jgi:hypothetical protein